MPLYQDHQILSFPHKEYDHAQRATFWKQSCGLGTCIATKAFMSQHGKVVCGIIRHYSIIGACIIYDFFPSITGTSFHVFLEETQQNDTVAMSADIEVFGSLHELSQT